MSGNWSENKEGKGYERHPQSGAAAPGGAGWGGRAGETGVTAGREREKEKTPPVYRRIFLF